MAKKKSPKFNLEAVRGITMGPEAQSRKRKQQPGEIFEAKSPPKERDRLDRAISREYEADQQDRLERKKGKPRPGEQLEAQSDDAEQKETAAKEAFIRLAKERFKLCAEAEQYNRKEALDDLEFRAGKQWPDDIQNERNMDKRPCLTMNHIPQYIRQITNEQRQQRPAIQVNPVGDGADVDTAEIIQGIIRHIEVNSDADIAYDTAFEHMVTSGFGYWRIVTDYADYKSFDQELCIKRIKNPFTVYFDPAAVEPDYCDARFAFIVEDVPISEYKQQYPNTEAAGLPDFVSIGDEAADWATKDTIRVAEYFHVEEKPQTLVQLSDGTVTDLESVPEGAQIIRRKSTVERKVIWSKINAIEVIEEQEWPGYYIPIIPVLGDDIDIDGKRHLIGLVRNLKDPQRMYNYWVSSATETIALAPKAPFLVPEGADENHEVEWAEANNRNFSKLTYKAYDEHGRQLPVPQRQIYEPPVQAFNMMTKQADNDLKAGAGIYDASLGQKGPDQSGRAILARQKQTDIATLNFSDNLARSIRFTGKQLIDLIPKIYPAPRVQRIINPDQTVDYRGIYNSENTPNPPMMMHQGQALQKVYDIGVGHYDVSVSVGPSYQSKRQEAVASQLEMAKAYPPLMGIAGDLVVGNMDWPGAKQMAERIKKTLPPQLQDGDDSDPEVRLMKLQSQLQAISQQHEIMAKLLNEKNQIIETKQVEQQTQIEIAKIRAGAQVASAEITAKSQNLRARAQMEADEMQMFHDSAHEVGMSQMEHKQALQQQAVQAANQPTAGEEAGT